MRIYLFLIISLIIFFPISLYSNELEINGTNNSNTKFTPPKEMMKEDWSNPVEMERTWQSSIVRIPYGFGKSKLSSVDMISEDLFEKNKRLPTIIFLHGCYGIHSGTHHRIKFLADNGFLIIAPVSFARSKYPKSCDIYTYKGGLYRGTLNIRRFDAKYAIKQLKGFNFVDEENIILMGHSQGGIATATLKFSDISQKLKARIIEGWNCNPDSWPEYSGMNATKREMVLSLVGKADPWFAYSNYKLGCGPLLNKENGSKGIIYSDSYLQYEHSLLEHKKPKKDLLDFLKKVIEN